MLLPYYSEALGCPAPSLQIPVPLGANGFHRIVFLFGCFLVFFLRMQELLQVHE